MRIQELIIEMFLMFIKLDFDQFVTNERHSDLQNLINNKFMK
jgi:hypothetical protein